jgi:N-acyl-D-amino-acid deacylase
VYDLLITGGRILDGTGAPWYWADVAVQGDRVVAMGQLAGVAARRTIKADGRAVLAPVTPQTAGILREQLAGLNGRPDVDWDWDTITGYLDRFDGRVAVNVALLVPHGTVRLAVIGMENRAPTSDEMGQMKRLVDQGMREGAVGLSTGLTYAPAMYATDAELVELCQTLRPYAGFYCPHHRNYGMEALKAYRDSIEIGRRAGVPVHLTHCHLGYPVNKGRAADLLSAIDQARADGVEVTMDSYPYLAGSTYLHAFLPGWMHEGGTEATIARLRSPDNQERLRHEMEVAGSDGFSGVPMGWEMVQISGIMGEHDPELVGMLLPDAAARSGQTPYDFFVDLLVQTRLGVSCLVHIGNEENVQTILQHAAYMVGSDGILVGERPHPRGWGTHVRFLAHYVRDLGLLSWEEGVRKMTSASARRIGCLDRGILHPGFVADLVVFDPDILRDTATYQNPRSYPEGVSFVVVNGTVVIDEGEPTGATPGRALREPYGRKPERITGPLQIA